MSLVTPQNPKAGDTVRVYFSTSGSTGGRVDPSSGFEAADFLIYKNGSSTEKTTTNGITITSTFDSKTGLHILELDTSNNTGDTGFWADGADYSVALYPDETVDSVSVSHWIGAFSLRSGVTLKVGTGTGELDITSGVVKANFAQLLGTGLTEGASGRLAAGLVAFFNVASPALTVASVNQTGDNYARLGSPAGESVSADIAAAKAVVDAISTAITNLNNLSAKANIFGSAILEIPDSGTRVYQYTLVVKDDEDKLVALDSSPTLTLVNASGTDRSALLSAVSNPSTGQYTWTVTVGTSTNNESLTLTATGAFGAETRLAKLGLQVVDYDTATAIAAIQSAIATVQSTFPTNFNALQITADGKIGPLASNAITAGVIDTDAIGASEFSDAAANKVRDAVLDRVLSGNHDTAGSTGKVIQDTYAKANSAEGIVTNGTYGNSAIKTLIDTKPSAAQNADAVWDEATTDHQTAGTTGKALTDAGTGGGGDATLANQTLMLKLLQADVTLDTTTTPWRLVWKEAGTATVLFQKELTQEDGTDVTSMEHRLANQVAP